MCHVTSRGNRHEDIFLDDVDGQDFLKTLAEPCQKTGWQMHASCLMRNHYHLVLETPDANLVAGMAWLQSSYTIRLRAMPFGNCLAPVGGRCPEGTFENSPAFQRWVSQSNDPKSRRDGREPA